MKSINNIIKNYLKFGDLKKAIEKIESIGLNKYNLIEIANGMKEVNQQNELVDCSKKSIIPKIILNIKKHNQESDIDRFFNIPSFESESRLNYYRFFFKEPNSNSWCWITKKGNFIPVGYTHHNKVIIELYQSNLIEYSDEMFAEKDWVKVTRSGIYIQGNINTKQKLTIEKLLLKEENFHLFFDDNNYCEINSFNYIGVHLEKNRLKWIIKR